MWKTQLKIEAFDDGLDDDKWTPLCLLKFDKEYKLQLSNLKNSLVGGRFLGKTLSLVSEFEGLVFCEKGSVDKGDLYFEKIGYTNSFSPGVERLCIVVSVSIEVSSLEKQSFLDGGDVENK